METHRGRLGQRPLEDLDRALGVLAVGRDIDVGDVISARRREQNVRQIRAQERLAARR